MRAIILGGYGSTDLDFVHGHPLVRFSGLFKPGYPILGSDCVGRIEAISNKITGFNVEDIIWVDLSIELANIYLGGIIKPVIDKVISLEETIAGLRELEDGKVLGKIVVKM